MGIFISGYKYYSDKRLREEHIENIIYSVFNCNSTDEIEQLFDSSVLSIIPAPDLLDYIQDIKGGYGSLIQVKISKYIPLENAYTFQLILNYSTAQGTIGFSLNSSDSDKITMFYLFNFEISQNYIESISLQDLINEFEKEKYPGNKSLIIKVGQNIIYSYNPNMSIQVGSEFKLYVLKALISKVESDPSVNWDTTIKINASLKSLPSGILQNEPEGKTYTLSQLSHYMINISDNTATDHIINFLGREYVETFLPANYDLPFLMTSESFKIRFLLNRTEIINYLNMNVSQRRQYLSNYIDPLNITSIDLENINFSADIDVKKQIEWTFSNNEILSVLEDLENYSFLQDNPGLAGPQEWKRISFKGGGDVGVYTLSHALLTTNDTHIYIIFGVNNYDKIMRDIGIFVYRQYTYTALIQKLIEKMAVLYNP
ncbi:MAG: serine hydrolase [Promethearchaeota archaeon]